MKFLIVDDSKIARKKMSSFISELGFEIVGEATDGLEALRLSHDLAPTHITMDLEMPNMKGNEASQKILALNPNINILLITSIVDKKELIGAINLGVKKVLQKPITIEMLQDALNEIEQ